MHASQPNPQRISPRVALVSDHIWRSAVDPGNCLICLVLPCARARVPVSPCAPRSRIPTSPSKSHFPNHVESQPYPDLDPRVLGGRVGVAWQASHFGREDLGGRRSWSGFEGRWLGSHGEGTEYVEARATRGGWTRLRLAVREPRPGRRAEATRAGQGAPREVISNKGRLMEIS